MTEPNPLDGNRSVEQLSNYVESLAEAHGVSGYTRTPDGTVVYAAYDDGSYGLRTPDGHLTNTESDITSPKWLRGRESLLAYRDEDGTEQFDLVEVDPETGVITPVLVDQYRNCNARQHPTDPNRIAFVSNRDGSLGLYTLHLDEGEITSRSKADEPVTGYAWSPNGQRLVYQAGTVEDSGLRLVDCHLDRDDVLLDEPDSEQSFAVTDDGRGAWSEAGIVFTTNHQTGYRELAVADGDGDDELRYVNNRDKYDPQWTSSGDIVFLEARGGDRRLCLLSDGEVTTIERTGTNEDVTVHDGDVYYDHRSTTTAGDLRRNGTTLVDEGRVDARTVAPEEVRYESFDGQAIAARLYQPEESPIGGIVTVYGGPEAQHFNRLDPVTQILVHAGFEVLAPDCRGSRGYGRAFRKASDGDLGGDDITDVVAGAEDLRHRGRDTVGILGASYGGYIALMSVGTTEAFDFGASVCGVVDWKTAVEDARQSLGDAVLRKLEATAEETPDVYEERSPIAYADDIDVPLLLVQGANDPRVPQSEAERLVTAVSDRDIDHEYLLFEDEGHGIERTANRIAYITQSIEFFTEHV